MNVLEKEKKTLIFIFHENCLYFKQLSNKKIFFYFLVRRPNSDPNKVKIINFLIKNNANITCKNKDKQTVLELALEFSSETILKLFLDNINVSNIHQVDLNKLMILAAIKGI